LPGHSPGSIALFGQQDGTLFSGDVIYDDVLLDTIDGSDPSFGPRRLHSIIDRYLQERP
jgi:glyoxylase-like metal-dependent hydrolase (beta-lactamase superfamily II)